jgi:hypothetical protein
MLWDIGVNPSIDGPQVAQHWAESGGWPRDDAKAPAGEWVWRIKLHGIEPKWLRTHVCG